MRALSSPTGRLGADRRRLSPKPQSSIVLISRQGLLSRRAWGPHGDEKMLGAFALGVVWTFCILLIGAMLLFGPKILELIDGN
jgi:hypothetical protein